MLYSDHPRVRYQRAQLAEVICQLRFPAILSISANEPQNSRRPCGACSPNMRQGGVPRPRLADLGTSKVRLNSPRASSTTTSSPPTAGGS